MSDDPLDDEETPDERADRLVELVLTIVEDTDDDDYEEDLLRDEIQSSIESGDSDEEILQEFYDEVHPDAYHCCSRSISHEWALYHLAIAHRDKHAAYLVDPGTRSQPGILRVPWPRRAPFPIAYFNIVTRRWRCEWTFSFGPGAYGQFSAPDILRAMAAASIAMGLRGKDRAPGHED